MNKNYLFFDLDGTVTDPQEGITKSVRYSLESLGIRVDSLDSLVKFIGPPLKESYRRYYDLDGDQADAAIVKYREYYAEKGIYENCLYPGIKELLASQQAKGKKLVLATSKPTYYAEIILKHFGIADFFTFVAGSEMNGDRVKKGDVIQYAMANCRLHDAAQAVMIGDRMHDMAGARSVGMDSIGVLYGYGGLEELSAEYPTHIVATVEDLGRLLG